MIMFVSIVYATITHWGWVRAPWEERPVEVIMTPELEARQTSERFCEQFDDTLLDGFGTLFIGVYGGSTDGYVQVRAHRWERASELEKQAITLYLSHRWHCRNRTPPHTTLIFPQAEVRSSVDTLHLATVHPDGKVTFH